MKKLFLISLLLIPCCVLLLGQKADIKLRRGHFTFINSVTLESKHLVSTGDRNSFVKWDAVTGKMIRVENNNEGRWPYKSIDCGEKLPTTIPAEYILTADRRYYADEKDKLVPVCDQKDSLITFDCDIVQVGYGGHTIAAIRGDSLILYHYPSLEEIRRLQLKDWGAYEKRLWRFKLTGGGGYFLAKEEGGGANRWHRWDTYSGDHLVSKESGKILNIYDGHPSEDVLLAGRIWSEDADDNIVVGRLDPATLTIDLVYDTIYGNGNYDLGAYDYEGYTVFIAKNEHLARYFSATGKLADIWRSLTNSFSNFIVADDEGYGFTVGSYEPEEPSEFDWFKHFNFFPAPRLEVRATSFLQNRTLGVPPVFSTGEFIPATQLPNNYLDYASLAEEKAVFVPSLPEGRNTYAVYAYDYLLLYHLDGRATLGKDIVPIEDDDLILSNFFQANAPGKYHLLGMGDSLLLYDQSGQLLRSGHLPFGKGRAADFSADGRFLYVTNRDGVISIINTQDMSWLVSLALVGAKDWVAIGPNTVFDGSPGGMEHIYYVVNNAESEGEEIELEQMKERFYDPGLLYKAMGFSEAPIRQVSSVDQLPLHPVLDAAIRKDTLVVSLSARSGGIGRVALYVNGKELDRDIRRSSMDTIIRLSLQREAMRKFYLFDNVISLRAYNTEESLHSKFLNLSFHYSDGVQVTPRGNEQGSRDLLTESQAMDARLHVVCIGTSDYTGSAIDLSYPDQDANSMAAAFSLVGNELFGTHTPVKVYCLTTQTQAEADNQIPKGINWLRASKDNIVATLEQLQSQTRPQDVVVLYLSGHGKTVNIDDKEQFHYLTEQASSTGLIDKSILDNIALSSMELADYLRKMPAYKQVVIIDACNSGQIISDLKTSRNLNGSQRRALDRMSGRAGMYLLAGSAADRVSFEASNYGQGLLTYALLEGMRGGALRADEKADSNLYVGVTELFEYAQQRVPQLASSIAGVQQPQMTYPVRAGSFPVGIYNRNTPIELADAKPIIINPVLVSDYFFTDTLQLEDQIANFLRSENHKGKKASFIYVNASKFPNAYELRGQYKIEPNGQVAVELYLVRPGSKPLKIEVPPASNSIIADDIVWELTEVLKRLKESD